MIKIKSKKKADKKADRPIDKAVEKWRQIAFEGGVDKGPNNCALCEEFFDDYCEDCPVREDTGEGGCRDTPFEAWENHQNDDHGDENEFKVYCEVCRRLAVEEMAYLMRIREDYC